MSFPFCAQGRILYVKNTQIFLFLKILPLIEGENLNITRIYFILNFQEIVVSFYNLIIYVVSEVEKSYEKSR